MTGQPSLFDPPPAGRREGSVRFVEGILATWFETRVGVKPRKADAAEIRQLAEKFTDDFDALVARVFRDEGRTK